MNHFINTKLGSISPTRLLAAFTLPDPQSAKSNQCLFVLLGSACAKAAHKMLVKLAPGEYDFITWPASCSQKTWTRSAPALRAEMAAK